MASSKMGKLQSLFLTDEEMGKKDDDHKPIKAGFPSPSGWAPARAPPRKSLKRLLILLLLVAAAYLFFKNLPTDIGIRDHRRPVYRYPGGRSKAPPTNPKHPHSAEGGPDEELNSVRDTTSSRSYNGPVRFLNLAASLHAITNTRGQFLMNKNVLFAASSLKSAAALLPVACQMGSELRSYVHFALMSRSSLEIDELRQINGIDDSCQIIFHDARPDYSEISADSRLESGVTRALYHINNYMHPQAIIVDGSSTEEAFFTRATREQARELKTTLIELPRDGAKKLTWMTKLDSAGLNAWNRVSVDILIHAHPGASGSLIRLLRSLSAADYTACAVPHITIELPQEIDPPTERFLETFQWPPARFPNPSNVRQLSLRHRIPRHGVSEEESSSRFLESFWPSHPPNSHVLVLSPQTELSPNFFHYLKYTILEYKYSNAAILQEWDSRLFGISLELPLSHLDSSKPFTPPSAPKSDESSDATSQGPTSFLWQAPNSNALLFFGERWVELHGFVSRLLDVQRNLDATPEILASKLVSKRYPSWLEHALRLSRARGYWTLYPSALTADVVATVHSELYTPPEEYEQEVQRDTGGARTEITLVSRPLLQTLSKGGSLPPFNDLPLLDWDGAKTDLEGFNAAASAYIKDFRRTVGGCDGESQAKLDAEKSAKDLFCNKDE